MHVILVATTEYTFFVHFVTGALWLNKQWSDTSQHSANISPAQISRWFSLSGIIKRSTFRYRLGFWLHFLICCMKNLTLASCLPWNVVCKWS